MAESGTLPTEGRGRYGILPIIFSATFMQLLDLSIVNVAIPQIQAKLAATFAQTELVVAGYQLTFAVTLITASRLGDIYGRRRLFMIGMAGFTISSILCGAAQQPSELVASRLLQGLFSGLMFPQVISIIQVTYPKEERGRVFGLYGATIGLATILGPLAGGILLHLNLFGLSWRSIFYVNVPVGILALIGTAVRVPESRGEHRERVDVVGVLLSSIGIGMVVFPLVDGRNEGWPRWIKAMLVGGVVLVGIFLFLQRRASSKEGAPTLIQWRLLHQRSFAIGLAISIVFFLGVAPFFYVLTISLQIGLEFTPLAAGVTTLPFAVGTALGSTISNRLVVRYGKVVLVVGCLLLIAAMVSLVVVLREFDASVTGYNLVPFLALAGLGLGLVVAPLTNILLSGVEVRDAGSASGVFSTVQQLGGAFGIALIGIVFFGFLGTNSTYAASRAAAPLERHLIALSVPRPLITLADALFTTCVHDRATERDPTLLPQSCLTLAGGIEAVPISPADKHALLTEVEHAGTFAAAIDFVRSLEDAMYYEIGVFLLAIILIMALPQRTPLHRDDGEMAAS